MRKTIINGEARIQIGPALGKIARLMKETDCSPFYPLPHLWVAMILLSLALLPYQSRKRPHEEMTKGTGQRIKRTTLGFCLGIFQPICYTYLGESVFSVLKEFRQNDL